MLTRCACIHGCPLFCSCCCCWGCARPSAPSKERQQQPLSPHADACVVHSHHASSTLPPLLQVLLLENVRFYPEEEKNDAEFAKKLAANADM